MNAPKPDRPWVPLEQETDVRERKRREEHALKLARQQRVEARDLESCDRCGGAYEIDVDDESLRCVCPDIDARRLARAIARSHDRLIDPGDDLADRIAP